RRSPCRSEVLAVGDGATGLAVAQARVGVQRTVGAVGVDVQLGPLDPGLAQSLDRRAEQGRGNPLPAPGPAYPHEVGPARGVALAGPVLLAGRGEAVPGDLLAVEHEEAPVGAEVAPLDLSLPRLSCAGLTAPVVGKGL